MSFIYNVLCLHMFRFSQFCSSCPHHLEYAVLAGSLQYFVTY